MPFKDRASRSTPSTLLPDVGHAPDPNIALYGADGPAGTRSAAQGGSSLNPPAPAPEPGGSAENPLSDAIGQIIAGLDKPPAMVDNKPSRASGAAPVTKQPTPTPHTTAMPPAASTAGAVAHTGAPKPATPQAAAKPATTLPPPAARQTSGARTTYYLQTGAFRSKDEAQAMLARVIMLGLPVHIEAAEANGTAINRVRVGPFKGIDDMNRARTRLGDDKIESAVVRP